MLFDAVSCRCGRRRVVSYEGQAAVDLEMALDPAEKASYPVALRREDGTILLPAGSLIRAIVSDIQKGASAGVISARFHNWLARSLLEVALILRQEQGIETVALSGGCFQNTGLLGSLKALLRDRGFEVLINRMVPPNDGGISFGQAVVASARAAGGGPRR